MLYQDIAPISGLNKGILGIILLFASLTFIQSAASDSVESAQKMVFHPLYAVESTSFAETADASGQVKSAEPGIVQIPIQKSSAVYGTDKEQTIKTDHIIDTGKILDFTNSASRSDMKGSLQAEAIPMTIVGDNPSVVASSRSRENNDWGRSQTDSTPDNTKGRSSILANGVMMSVRMAL